MLAGESHSVQHSLSGPYDRVMYLLEPGELTNDLRKAVTVFDCSDGAIVIRHHGVPLQYSVFDKVGKVSKPILWTTRGWVVSLLLSNSSKSSQARNAVKKSRRAWKKAHS